MSNPTEPKKPITEREWFTPVIIIGFVAPLLVGVALYHYTNWFDSGRVAESDVSEIDVSVPEQSVTTDSVLSSIESLSDAWSESYADLAESHSKTNQELLSNLEKQLEERQTFAYLEGDTPNNNFGVFLRKYYGIDDNPRLGDGLIESMVGDEVEWALKVVDVQIYGEQESAFIFFGAITDICEETPCPDDFRDLFAIHIDRNEDVVTAIKKNDFVHIRGPIYVWKPENAPDLSYRQRMHVHVTRYRYIANSD